MASKISETGFISASVSPTSASTGRGGWRGRRRHAGRTCQLHGRDWRVVFGRWGRSWGLLSLSFFRPCRIATQSRSLARSQFGHPDLPGANTVGVNTPRGRPLVLLIFRQQVSQWSLASMSSIIIQADTSRIVTNGLPHFTQCDGSGSGSFPFRDLSSGVVSIQKSLIKTPPNV